MVQIIITPYIHLQYFDLFFSQQTWLNPVLLRFCRWKRSEKITSTLAILIFSVYSLTSMDPWQPFHTSQVDKLVFTSYSLQNPQPLLLNIYVQLMSVLFFTKKTEEIKNDFHHFSPYTSTHPPISASSCPPCYDSWSVCNLSYVLLFHLLVMSHPLPTLKVIIPAFLLSCSINFPLHWATLL